MRSVTLPACAKVNLHLNVLKKRTDGYHELETLFERVDLADRLTVERRAGDGVELRCDSSEVPGDSTNLVVQAAESFRSRSGWKDGIRIVLEKEIPAGAGLGGGSSDAASALLALQALSAGALSSQELLRCGREIGADVPFFLTDTPWAIGRGRGDEIEPIGLKIRLWHLLVTPEFSISTKAVYGAFTLTPPSPDATLLLRALRDGELSRVRDLLFNALEPTVEALYPAVRSVKAAVGKLGSSGRPCVSGSGSTVFSVCESREQAERSAERLRQERPRWRVFAATTA